MQHYILSPKCQSARILQLLGPSPPKLVHLLPELPYLVHVKLPGCAAHLEATYDNEKCHQYCINPCYALLFPTAFASAECSANFDSFRSLIRFIESFNHISYRNDLSMFGGPTVSQSGLAESKAEEVETPNTG